MKAMIFAAGLGTRLKPYTLHHPKALVPVGGKPMLQRVIENIASAGIRDIVVNVHHFASQVEDFLAQNSCFGLNISISDERDLLLDTGGGLLKARELLSGNNPDEPILLHNADILTDMRLEEMAKEHLDTGADVTLLCSHRKSSRTLWFSKEENCLEGWENMSTGERRPEGFSPDASAEATPFGGIHIVNPSVFPFLEKYSHGRIKPFPIIPFYLENIERMEIRRFMLPEDCRWFDVGSSDKLAIAEASIQSL